MYFTYTIRKCVFLIEINVCWERVKVKNASNILRKFRSLILHRFPWDAKIRHAFMGNFRKARCSGCKECNADVALRVRTKLHNLIWTVERFRTLIPCSSIKRSGVGQTCFSLILFTVYSLKKTSERKRESEKENAPHARAPLSGKLEVCSLLKRYTWFDDDILELDDGS